MSCERGVSVKNKKKSKMEIFIFVTLLFLVVRTNSYVIEGRRNGQDQDSLLSSTSFLRQSTQIKPQDLSLQGNFFFNVTFSSICR